MQLLKGVSLSLGGNPLVTGISGIARHCIKDTIQPIKCFPLVCSSGSLEFHCSARHQNVSPRRGSSPRKVPVRLCIPCAGWLSSASPRSLFLVYPLLLNPEL